MKVDDLIHVMESFIGTTESPPGSNQTPIGAEYGWNGVAWCAETVSVACHRLGFPLHEAAVSRIEAHARAGDWGMGWSKDPVLGAAVVFDWKGRGNPADMHTGVVKEVISRTRFRSIEGNYHDSCAEVLRDTLYVRGFATFPFEVPDGAAPPVPPPVPAQNQSSAPNPFGDWPHVSKPVLRRRSRGNEVVYLQKVIYLKAGGGISIDGDFGPQTEGRVRTVQQNNGIGVDGIVGPQTWGVIDRLATS